MLIGIVADIHDSIECLKTALRILRRLGANPIVTLGDAFDSFGIDEPGAQVARLLRDAAAVGVWGNHDFGLSHDVTGQVRDLADPEVLAFASRLGPFLVIDECRFSHIEPWKDAASMEDLWVYDGVPETGERAEQSFGAVPERVLFTGHFHTRRILGRNGPRSWDGIEPIRLPRPDPYLVLMPAILDGWCAVYETDLMELRAIPCGDTSDRPSPIPDLSRESVP